MSTVSSARIVGNGSGGTNWPGGGYDPETHIVYAGRQHAGRARSGSHAARRILGHPVSSWASPAAVPRSLRAPGLLRRRRAADSRARPALPATGLRQCTAPAGGFGGFNVQGLPISKPPYGLLAAINLDKGELKWQVPHGETPDVVRNHPALKGLDIPKTGQAQARASDCWSPRRWSIMGDPTFTTTPDHPRGAMLRAYDKATGKKSARCSCRLRKAARR